MSAVVAARGPLLCVGFSRHQLFYFCVNQRAFNHTFPDTLGCCFSLAVSAQDILIRVCWILYFSACQSMCTRRFSCDSTGYSASMHMNRSKVVMREACRQRNAQKRKPSVIYISAKEHSHALILVPQAGALVHLGASSGQCGDWNRQHRGGRLAFSWCSEADAGFWNTI